MKLAHIGTALPNREDRDWVVSSELTDTSGISYRQLDYWCRTGLLATLDDSNPGSGWARRFPETQVLRACTLAALLAIGVSLQTCREVIDELLDRGRVDLGPFTLVDNLHPTHRETA